MFLFFDLFHTLNDLIDSFHEITDAIEDCLPPTEKRQLEKELRDMQHEFHTLWLSADDQPEDTAGLTAWLDKMLAQADRFSQHARRAKRFDLVRGVNDLQEQIRSSRACKQPPEPRRPATLAAFLERPSFTAPEPAFA
jgi:uncharacterized coiled-coil DUF342 family protein